MVISETLYLNLDPPPVVNAPARAEALGAEILALELAAGDSVGSWSQPLCSWLAPRSLLLPQAAWCSTVRSFWPTRSCMHNRR